MRLHLKKSLIWVVSVVCFILLTFNLYNRKLWLPTERSRPWESDFHNSDEHENKRHPKMAFLGATYDSRGVLRNLTLAPKEKSRLGVTEVPKNNMTVIWPDKVFYDNDRITNQLNFKPKWLVDKENANENIPLKKILMYSGGWQVKMGRESFVEQKCKVNTCELTSQRELAQTADAIIFNASPQMPWAPRPFHQIWILFMLESPYHTPGLSAFSNIFNWTATYRHDSDIVAPYEKFVYYNDSVRTLPQNKSYAAGKTKKVAWFVSNCGARNRRKEYAKELQKYIEVDIFGNCGTNQCPRGNAKCFQMLNTDYKFYLSFENSNCRDYITEKFFVTGLQHDLIPIVMGGAPEDYARSAPPHSYIHVDDFESPEQLAQYLHKLDQNDDLYNEYFRWKGTGTIINTYFWCRVCAMLHENTRPSHSYRNLEKWWRGEGVCIGKDNWRQHQRTSKTIADDFLA